MEALLTAWLVLLSLALPFAAGWPLRRLLAEDTDDPREVWCDAPLLGFSAAVLFLENLVFLKVTVAASAPWFCGATVLAWAALLWRKTLPARRAFPALALAIALGVFAVQGAGLLKKGASSYVGRGWVDQYNYTSTAHFLLEKPCRTECKDLAGEVYLHAGWERRQDRLGQSVYQALLIRLSNANGLVLFGPLILSGVFLTVWTAWSAARRLGFGDAGASWAALCGGLMPALSALHLECFLSQVLALPFFFALPHAASELCGAPTWRRAARASLLLAAALAVYTELAPIFAALFFLPAVVGLLRDRRLGLRCLPWLGAALGAALLLNLAYLPNALAVLRRGGQEGVLGDLYPWALQLEGLARLWVGDRYPTADGGAAAVLNATAAALIGVACLGLAHLARERYDGLSCGLLFLGLLPALIALAPGEHPYQYYKAWLSVAAVLPIGIHALGRRAAAWPASRLVWVRPAARWGRWALPAALGVCAFLMTRGPGPPGRDYSFFERERSARETRESLRRMEGQTLFLSAEESLTGAWLAFEARRNWVRVCNSVLGDRPAALCQSDAQVAPERLREAWILFPVERAGALCGPAVQTQWRNRKYAMHRVTSGAWAWLAWMDDRPPTGRVEDQHWRASYDGAGALHWELWAGRDCAVLARLRAAAMKAGGVREELPAMEARFPGADWRAIGEAADGGLRLPLALKAGCNRLELRLPEPLRSSGARITFAELKLEWKE